MSTEERSGARRTTATVVATAAVTLAIGVTAAALGGYLVPNRSVGTPDVGGAATPATVETVATSQPAMPSVVLVPVAPDSQREAPAAFPRQAEPEVLLAVYEPNEHREDDDVEEHWRGDHHHPRHELGSLAVRECTRRLRRMLRNGRAKILFATVSTREGGRWRVSLNVEAAPLHAERRHAAGDRATPVGIDRGLKTFAVIANAEGRELERIDSRRPLSS